MSELNLSLLKIETNNTFYINMYRHLLRFYLIFSIVMLCLAIVSVYIAINPHKTRAIITTIDGRLLEPNNAYFKVNGIWSNFKGRFS